MPPRVSSFGTRCTGVLLGPLCLEHGQDSRRAEHSSRAPGALSHRSFLEWWESPGSKLDPAPGQTLKLKGCQSKAGHVNSSQRLEREESNEY